MVQTDNNNELNQSNNTDPAVPETSQLEDSGASKKRFLLLLIISLAFITGLLFILSRVSNRASSDVLFSINGEEFTKSEIEPYLKYPAEQLQQTREDAAKQIFEMYKTKTAAEQLGLKPTDQNMEVAYKRLNRSADDPDPWVKLRAHVLGVEERIKVLDQTSTQGYSYVFDFGDKMHPWTFDKKPTGWRDTKAIASDRAYAKEKADFYHAQLTGNKMKPEQVLEAVRTDGRLGLVSGKPGPGMSTQFGQDPAKSWQQQVLQKDIVKTIEALENPQTTDVLTGKTASVEVPASDADYQETFYYFVHLTGKPGDNHSKRLSNAVTALDAHFYGGGNE